MKLTYKDLHPKFKLNGTFYTITTLKEHGICLSKSEEAYNVYIGKFLINWLDEKTTIEVTTSGSTGTPKVIVLEKQHMVNSAIATGDFFKLTAGKTALHCLPTNFIAGKMMLVRAMVLGLAIDCISPSLYPLDAINAKEYDFCAMVPLQVKKALDKLDSIKILIVGGAPMSLSLKKQVYYKHTQIFETYGMTETITHIAVKKINKTSGSSSDLFKTLSNVTITTDKRNCLVINAPAISKETVVTNDIVKLVSETTFKWLGRHDSVINSGGVKLIPEQIEAKLGTILECRFFVAGITDVQLGQKLVLIIEGEVAAVEIEEKIKSLKTLERFEIPKEIYTVHSFLETKNGKVQRAKTLELLKK